MNVRQNILGDCRTVSGNGVGIDDERDDLGVRKVLLKLFS